MPKNYSLEVTPPNQMRRPEYACDDAWIREFLRQAEVGHIATIWDEQPFITPILFYYEAETNEIYFHSNIVGRLRANIERQPRVCFETSRSGKLLPSNAALEFSLQYESVIAFGEARLLERQEDKQRALYKLIEKYFPGMSPGKEYRPITDKELARTSVYALAITSWSGKRNWKERAVQIPEWPPLDERWFR